MKRMDFFKRFDFLVQMMLFVVWLGVALAAQGLLLYLYCITGGWQIVSILVHAFADKYFYKDSSRTRHAWTALVTGVCALPPLGAVTLVIFFGLLIITPVFATWYSIICYSEIETARQQGLTVSQN
jgi:hypothetical protein